MSKIRKSIQMNRLEVFRDVLGAEKGNRGLIAKWYRIYF